MRIKCLLTIVLVLYHSTLTLLLLLILIIRKCYEQKARLTLAIHPHERDESLRETLVKNNLMVS